MDRYLTAAAMLEFHRKTPFDFGVTLGDNFYDVGMTSPGDARWKTQWEDMYAALGVKFYAIASPGPVQRFRRVALRTRPEFNLSRPR